MKKKSARQEGKKNTVPQEWGQSLRLAFFLDCSSRPGVVDLLWIDGKEGRCRGDSQQRRNHEDGAIPKLVADVSDQQGGKYIAGGVKCLIFSELLIKCTGPDNSECNGRNRGREKSSYTTDEELCGIYRCRAEIPH